eukprot:NODE_2214_length_1652_cov_22.039895_g1897_i0.p1 GENE.NODE_2214_length_1652_cov_22.039895_g1897_i0~~NODE_2214_length_1652_cov_22.039895_g1897_i0.p1  ORF type:complete len:225 (-),score=3.82 NODE_2214_length_1652_cov_22.039895_g1897_i0:922-1596(-)
MSILNDSCCSLHGQNGSLQWIESLPQERFFLLITPNYHNVVIPPRYLSRTSGLARCILRTTEGPVIFPIPQICSLHQRRQCNYAILCKHIHLCREFYAMLVAENVIPPLSYIPTKTQRKTTTKIKQEQRSRSIGDYGSDDEKSSESSNRCSTEYSTSSSGEFTHLSSHTPLSRIKTRLEVLFGDHPLPPKPVNFMSELLRIRSSITSKSCNTLPHPASPTNPHP